MGRSLEDIKKVPKRNYSDDLDLGDLTLLDLTHAETHLKEIRKILDRLSVKTYAENMPLRWHEIFINGMADLLEWQQIAKLQGKTEVIE